MINVHRPTWMEINLDAVATNLHLIKDIVGKDIRVLGAVKANAYGHGAVACAKRLAKEGIDWVGVAIPEEGVELREAGITQPILVLGGFWRGQEQACIQYQLTPIIYRIDMAEALNSSAKNAGRVVDIHIKIDTGMGRLGVRYENVKEFALSLMSLKNIRVDGLMTHFAVADNRELDQFTNEQIRRFKDAVSIFRECGFNPTYEDLANSAAIYAHSLSWGNMVRPGGILYGIWRDILSPTNDIPPFQPVMSLYTEITLLKRIKAGETVGYGCTFKAERETLIATLPIGYNDGYPRRLSNCGRAIVRGKYVPIAGRVSMDLTLIDVTDVPEVSLGDRVTLIGRDGEAEITVEEIAEKVGTLSYEISCGISGRVRRVIKGSA
jgi:alanine racemase